MSFTHAQQPTETGQVDMHPKVASSVNKQSYAVPGSVEPILGVHHLALRDGFTRRATSLAIGFLIFATWGVIHYPKAATSTSLTLPRPSLP